MSRRVFIIWSVIGLVVAGIVALPFLLPLDTYRVPIERAASRAIGRDVRIAGVLHFTIHPQIGLALSDVRIANAPGSRDPEMVSIGRVTIGARLMPLFSGRLEVTDIALDQPVVHLEINREGQLNWQMASHAEGSKPQAVDERKMSYTKFPRVRVDSGRVTWFDVRSGANEALGNVSLHFDLANAAPTPAQGLTASGSVTYKSEKLTVAARVDNLDDLLRAHATGAHASVSSKLLNAEFTGMVGAPGQAAGALKIGVPSPRAFADWIGHPMSPGRSIGLLTLEGQLEHGENGFTLRQARLALDAMRLSGDISCGLSHLGLDDGRVTYLNTRSGASEALEKFSLRLELPKGTTALNLNGALTYRSEEFKIAGRFESLDDLLQERGTGAQISVSSRIAEADFKGTVGTPGQITGALKIDAPSLRALADWAGYPLPPKKGVGVITLQGQIAQNNGGFIFKQADLTLGDMNLKGDISVGLSHVRIDSGHFTCLSVSSGTSETLEDISLQLELPNKTPALAVNGSLTCKAEELKISGRVENLGDLLKAHDTGAQISVLSRIVNADFKGTFGTPGQISGALKIGTPSLRAFAKWAGHPMSPGKGFGRMALAGQIAQTDSVLTLTKTELVLDSMNLKGDISFDTKTKPVTITGQAVVNRLDMRLYLEPGAAEVTTKSQRAKQPPPNAPLALDWLKSADANLTLTASDIFFPELTIDRAGLRVRLKGAVLNADADSLTFHGGTGKGSLMVDASSATPSFKHTLSVSGVDVKPLLDELLHWKRISGIGSLQMDLASRGATLPEIVKGLSGRAEIRLGNGRIAGINLVVVARLLQSVLTTPLRRDAVGKSAATDFTRLGATFAIKNGVMETKDLRLTSRDVEMDGRGHIDLPGKRLRLHFDPRARRGIPGLKLVDVGVAFYVTGPWNDPGYSPDATGTARGAIRKVRKTVTTPLRLLPKPLRGGDE